MGATSPAGPGVETPRRTRVEPRGQRLEDLRERLKPPVRTSSTPGGH
jgi:hypothetical protein